MISVLIAWVIIGLVAWVASIREDREFNDPLWYTPCAMAFMLMACTILGPVLYLIFGQPEPEEDPNDMAYV